MTVALRWPLLWGETWFKEMKTCAYSPMFLHKGHRLSFQRLSPTSWVLSQGLRQLPFLKSTKTIYTHLAWVCIQRVSPFGLWSFQRRPSWNGQFLTAHNSERAPSRFIALAAFALIPRWMWSTGDRTAFSRMINKISLDHWLSGPVGILDRTGTRDQAPP